MTNIEIQTDRVKEVTIGNIRAFQFIGNIVQWMTAMGKTHEEVLGFIDTYDVPMDEFIDALKNKTVDRESKTTD